MIAHTLQYLSPIIRLLTVTFGLLLSLIINSAPGGTIVITGIFILAVAFVAKKIQ